MKVFKFEMQFKIKQGFNKDLFVAAVKKSIEEIGSEVLSLSISPANMLGVYSCVCEVVMIDSWVIPFHNLLFGGLMALNCGIEIFAFPQEKFQVRELK